MSVALDFTERTDITAPAARRHRRFTLDEYERMIALDILTEQDSCELIRGQILEKNWGGESTYPPHHRFSLEQYEHMIKSGILTERDRCELIRGEIIEKMPIGDPHAVCVDRLGRLFIRGLDDDIALVRIQNPVVVLDSRPEPDVVLAKPRKDEYATAAPRSSDILLLIEVSESSLADDRTEKLSLFAEAGVCEYWIANVNAECIEVYRDPQPDGTYADRRIANLGETLGILALPNVSVAVDQVFKSIRDRSGN